MGYPISTATSIRRISRFKVPTIPIATRACRLARSQIQAFARSGLPCIRRVHERSTSYRKTTGRISSPRRLWSTIKPWRSTRNARFGGRSSRALERMIQKPQFSPAQPRRAETRLSPSCVLASLRPSTYRPGQRAALAARGGRVRKVTPRLLRHWALTSSRPSANVTLIILRVADLAAALLDELFHHPLAPMIWNFRVCNAISFYFMTNAKVVIRAMP